MDRYARPSSGPSLATKIIAVFTVVIAFIALIVVWGAFQSGDTGHVGVIRNGGPFDNKNFRGLLPASAGPTWIGIESSVRDYPSTERYDNVVPGVEGDPAAGDNLLQDAYRTSTRDGVSIGIKGQFHYDVNQDEQILAKFDSDYGQRSYPVPGTDERKEVSDGDDGFAAWIAGQVRPVEEETLRQVIANYDCVNYDPQCVYLKSANSADPDAIAKQLQNAPANNQVYQDVANSVVGLMKAKLAGTEFNGQRYPAALGGEYLNNVRFSFTGVDLGSSSVATIQRVQQAGAGAAEARANAAKDTAAAQGRAAVALGDAQANENRQRGYVNCPGCLQKELIAAQGEALGHLPTGLQVYIPGAGQSPTSLILPASK